VTKTSRLSGSR